MRSQDRIARAAPNRYPVTPFFPGVVRKCLNFRSVFHRRESMSMVLRVLFWPPPGRSRVGRSRPGPESGRRSRRQLPAARSERRVARAVLLVRRQGRGAHGATATAAASCADACRRCRRSASRYRAAGRRVSADRLQPAGRPRRHRQGSGRVRHRFPDPGRRDAVDRRIARRRRARRTCSSSIRRPGSSSIAARSTIASRTARKSRGDQALPGRCARCDARRQAGRSRASRGGGLPGQPAGARSARRARADLLLRAASRRC